MLRSKATVRLNVFVFTGAALAGVSGAPVSVVNLRGSDRGTHTVTKTDTASAKGNAGLRGLQNEPEVIRQTGTVLCYEDGHVMARFPVDDDPENPTGGKLMG